MGICGKNWVTIDSSSTGVTSMPIEVMCGILECKTNLYDEMHAGTLKIQSVSSLGVVEWKPLIDTTCSISEIWVYMLRTNRSSGIAGYQEIYSDSTASYRVDSLMVSDLVLSVVDGTAESMPLTKVDASCSPCTTVYGLYVQDNHNFILDSGFVVKDSSSEA